MANKIHVMVVRGEGIFNAKEAAKRLFVKTKYLSMATWRPGGKRRRASRND